MGAEDRVGKVKDPLKVAGVLLAVVTAVVAALLWITGTFNTKTGHRADTVDTRMQQMEWRAEDNLGAAIREEKRLRQWLEKHPGDRAALEDWNEAVRNVAKWTARQMAVETEKLKGGVQ